MPHRNEAATNRNVDQKYSRTSPMRRASQPVSGMAMALATPKKVMTHVPCEDATPMVARDGGRATLAMDGVEHGHGRELPKSRWWR